MGFHYCDNTAPNPNPKASDSMINGREKSGKANTSTELMASLSASKASVASSPIQMNSSGVAWSEEQQFRHTFAQICDNILLARGNPSIQSHSSNEAIPLLLVFSHHLLRLLPLKSSGLNIVFSSSRRYTSFRLHIADDL